MSPRIYLIVGVLIVLAGIWNYYRTNGGLVSKNHVPEINEDDFFKYAATNPNAVIIDFRTEQEFRSGFILNAVNIDFLDSTFREKIEALDPEYDYFVYCQAGSRSSKAAKDMKSIGIKRIFNLEGGINRWTKPLEH